MSHGQIHIVVMRDRGWILLIGSKEAQREAFINHLGKELGSLYCMQEVRMDGWIHGADLVFQSKKATGDYHDEMNSNNFVEWFHNKLLSNIKDNSLIVIDNASYHSRCIEKVPTSNTKKSEMQDWLTSHGIEYPECALKRELLSLIKLSNPKPKYCNV